VCSATFFAFPLIHADCRAGTATPCSTDAKPNKWGATWDRVFLQEFDCCGGLSRFLQMTFFTGGEVNEASNDPREWSYVEPDSVDETVLNYVCFGR